MAPAHMAQGSSVRYEGAAGEAVVAEGAAGGAEGDDLGVGGGVGGAEDLVVAAAEDGLAVGSEDDGAYGDFACGFSGAGLGEGEVHEVEVGHDAGQTRGELLRIAGLGLGFGAEEAGDLGGEGFDGGRARRGSRRRRARRTLRQMASMSGAML